MNPPRHNYNPGRIRSNPKRLGKPLTPIPEATIRAIYSILRKVRGVFQ